MGQSYTTNTGISALPEIDSQKYPEIYGDNLRLRNGIAILQGALDSYTGIAIEPEELWDGISPYSSTKEQNLTKVYFRAGEDLSYGNFCYIQNRGGIGYAMLSTATVVPSLTRMYCITPNGLVAEQLGVFLLKGMVGVTGLIPGLTYYTADSFGLIAAGSGTITHRIGFAITPDVLYFNPSLDYTIIPPVIPVPT